MRRFPGGHFGRRDGHLSPSDYAFAPDYAKTTSDESSDKPGTHTVASNRMGHPRMRGSMGSSFFHMESVKNSCCAMEILHFYYARVRNIFQYVMSPKEVMKPLLRKIWF